MCCDLSITKTKDKSLRVQFLDILEARPRTMITVFTVFIRYKVELWTWHLFGPADIAGSATRGLCLPVSSEIISWSILTSVMSKVNLNWDPVLLISQALNDSWQRLFSLNCVLDCFNAELTLSYALDLRSTTAQPFRRTHISELWRWCHERWYVLFSNNNGRCWTLH